MFTYLVEDQILFTCDAFGSHFCHEEMYDDKVGDFEDAFKYYFDVILKPFSKFMLKAIEKIKSLEIKVVCTGHGPILRTTWKKWVSLTETMSNGFLNLPVKNRVFIAYVSAYHKTGILAGKIAEGIRLAGNIEVDVCDIENMSIGDLEEKMTMSAGVVVGCPTINQNILLPVYKMSVRFNYHILQACNKISFIPVSVRLFNRLIHVIQDVLTKITGPGPYFNCMEWRWTSHELPHLKKLPAHHGPEYWMQMRKLRRD